MKKATIICVDDEKIILQSLRSQLRKAFGTKCYIEVAESGHEALEIIDELEEDGKDQPSLIISDQIMPQMKGDVLLSKIKERSPQTLCVLLTGQSDINDIISAINNAGIYRYIQKPWSELELNTTVREALVSHEKDLELNRVNLQLKELNRNLEKKVLERTKEIKLQNEKLAFFNKELNSNINYAKRIQRALLPNQSEIHSKLSDFFVFYRPLNQVSGDLYWSITVGDNIFLAVLDCTGHGVSGALLSVIGHELLTSIIKVKNILDPGLILTALHERFVKTLKQQENELQDGMDISLCRINKKEESILFASANQSVIIATSTFTQVIKGVRQPIGGLIGLKRNFVTSELEYLKDATYILFSDGYVDQFGGHKNKKLMLRRFVELVSNNYDLKLAEQKINYETYLDNWKQDNEQIDDITVLGFKL